MQYSKEFIDECKELYPDYTSLNELVEKGSPWVGRYLADSYSSSIDLDVILESESLDDLKDLARTEKRKFDLYKKWQKEYQKNGH